MIQSFLRLSGYESKGRHDHNGSRWPVPESISGDKQPQESEFNIVKTIRLLSFWQPRMV